MKLKRFFALLSVCCILVSICPNTSLAASDSITSDNTSSALTLTAASYRDKTLAGMLGHFGGFLTGYEFVWDETGQPYSPLPDEWFSVLNGPYSGNFTHAGDATYPGYNRFWEEGVVASDDDYHIDIFNQHILAEHGPNVSYYDIKEEWKEHYVHDWGAGFKAAYLTRYADLLPPFSGMREYGNEFYWCTEPYIENDTLGMAAPGMPQKASELAYKFASVTGDFDGVIWAKFGAALYALAYTEANAYDVVAKAATVLPEGSWPRTIYETCLSQYATENNWRNAVTVLASMKRNVDESDNVQTLTDINNSIIIISLLYGNNNYLDSLKIASLSGYDGDCNAATVGGIMGVLHGTSGTPEAIMEGLYPEDDCIYINDTLTYFDPYIKLNYPREQSLNDIITIFQSNAEAIILDEGGSIGNGIYTINSRNLRSPVQISILDSDFENVTHTGWVTTGNAAFSSSDRAHSGATCAKAASGSSLSQQVSGLETGKPYKLTCYIKTSQNGTAFLSLNSGTDTHTVTVRATPDYWVKRELEFVSNTTTATICLSAGNKTSDIAFFDNVALCQIDDHAVMSYEAEDAFISNADILPGIDASEGNFVGSIDTDSSSITFSVTVDQEAEYCLAIHYSNGGDYMSSHDLIINEVSFASIYYPKTAEWNKFYDDCVRIPVELKNGSNSIKLLHGMNYTQIDKIDVYKLNNASIDSPNEWYDTVSDPFNYLVNNDYEQGHSDWGIWPGNDFSGSGCSYIETGSAQSGTSYLIQNGSQPYEVYTDQTVSNIPNGHYTLSAYVKSSGGQKSCFMEAKNYGLGLPQKISIPAYGDDTWIYVEIPGILVQNGSITIGFYSLANAGNWLKVDNVKLLRETENLVTNFDFENENQFDYWSVWPGTSGTDGDASYYELGGMNNSARLTHCKASDYEVFTGQTLNHLENGTYTLTAWVKGTGSNKHFLSIKHHGSEEEICYFPVTEVWTQIAIRDISITSGKCEIGIYSNAAAYEWCSVDNIILQKTNTYYPPVASDALDNNLLKNPSFESNGNATLEHWGTWNGSDGSGENASFVESSGYDGSWRLTHYKASAYEVFNGQTINGLIPGHYTLSAWVIGDGASTHFLSIKHHGHEEQMIAIPAAPYPQWAKIEITNIIVSSGYCEIGLYSNAPANSWCSVDMIEFHWQGND